MESIKSKAKACAASLSHRVQLIQSNLMTSRPWFSDYLNPNKFSKPYKREACRRIRENSLYYLRNYLSTFALIFMLMTLSKPLFLMIFILMCGLWWYVYSQNGLVIKGKAIPSNLTFGLLSIFSGIVCLYFAWDSLLAAYAIIKFFILFHSLYHDLPPNTVSV